MSVDLCMRESVCVCVCVCERERECACVCVRERVCVCESMGVCGCRCVGKGWCCGHSHYMVTYTHAPTTKDAKKDAFM